MRASAVLTAGLLAAIASIGCDDNPLAENRDETTGFRLNPAVANVRVNDSTFVTAIPLNNYGEPTGAAVTASACDAKITIAPDPRRLAYEVPERYVVKGVATGETCINVSAGGSEATVSVRVRS